MSKVLKNNEISTDDMESLDAVSGGIEDSTLTRAAVLLQKKSHSVGDKSGVVNYNNPNEISCVCHGCGRVFTRDIHSTSVTCPFCQMKHHFESAEEVHMTRDDAFAFNKMRVLAVKTQLSNRRRGQSGFVLSAPDQDTHFNDAMTQTSLQMGTREYETYVEHIKENAPSKPDDQFHTELEGRNAQLQADMNEANAGRGTGDYFERKTLGEANKREKHDETIALMRQRAMNSKNPKDDAVVRRIGEDNPLIHDMNVSHEDYEERMASYIDSLSK